MHARLEKLIRLASEAKEWVLDHLEDLWEWHTDRLRESEAYRKALAAGVVAVVAEVTLAPAAAVVVTALATAYAAAYAQSTWEPRRPSYGDPYELEWH